jgi:hypothetical protein
MLQHTCYPRFRTPCESSCLLQKSVYCGNRLRIRHLQASLMNIAFNSLTSKINLLCPVVLRRRPAKDRERRPRAKARRRSGTGYVQWGKGVRDGAASFICHRKMCFRARAGWAGTDRDSSRLGCERARAGSNGIQSHPSEVAARNVHQPLPAESASRGGVGRKVAPRRTAAHRHLIDYDSKVSPFEIGLGPDFFTLSRPGYFCPTPRKGLIGKVLPTSLNGMRELAKTARAHFDQIRPPIAIWPDVKNQWFAGRGSRLSTLIIPFRGVGQK